MFVSPSVNQSISWLVSHWSVGQSVDELVDQSVCLTHNALLDLYYVLYVLYGGFPRGVGFLSLNSLWLLCYACVFNSTQ